MGMEAKGGERSRRPSMAVRWSMGVLLERTCALSLFELWHSGHLSPLSTSYTRSLARVMRSKRRPGL